MEKLRPTGRRHGNRVWPPSTGYDLAAPAYEQWYWREFWELNELPLIEAELRRRQAPGSAIDVGTGAGQYAAALSRLRTRSIVGLDVSEQMLRLARLRVPSAHLVRGSVVESPFATSAFDIALACRVLSHVQSLGLALAELGRITRPGGCLIFSDVAATHRYEATRIPTGISGDVHIETYKYTHEMITSSALSTGYWRLEFIREVSFKDLPNPPNPGEFPSVDESSTRPIFNYGVMLRIESSVSP